MTRFAALSLLALALSACAGAEADPKTAASPSSTAPPPEFQAACESFFARARTCTDQYIPTLVDLRIELDKPAGIAEASRTEGRDSIIAKANEEWANDSLPAAVTAMCADIGGKLPPEQFESMRAAGEHCMAMTDCGEFSHCAVELNRERMSH